MVFFMVIPFVMCAVHVIEPPSPGVARETRVAIEARLAGVGLVG
jgi:hypothetical protein